MIEVGHKTLDGSYALVTVFIDRGKRFIPQDVAERCLNSATLRRNAHHRIRNLCFKTMNRHVVILVVSNVAIALTSQKQRHQLRKTRRFSAQGYIKSTNESPDLCGEHHCNTNRLLQPFEGIP